MKFVTCLYYAIDVEIGAIRHTYSAMESALLEHNHVQPSLHHTTLVRMFVLEDEIICNGYRAYIHIKSEDEWVAIGGWDKADQWQHTPK